MLDFITLGIALSDRVLANPENPPAIDWAAYSSKITIPGLVESFQKQYEALKIPYPENKVGHLIDTQKAEVVILR